MKSEAKIIAYMIETYEEALYEVDNANLISRIESDLKAIGPGAHLLGLKSKLKHYQERIEHLEDTESAFGSFPEQQLKEMADFKRNLKRISLEIEQLSGTLKHLEPSHPAAENLVYAISQNATIIDARFKMCFVTSECARRIETDKEYIIELIPSKNDSIILTNIELEQMLTTLNELNDAKK